MPQSLFPLGHIVATPRALEALSRSEEMPILFLSRHAAGDWGNVDSQDWQANNTALISGSRLLSSYRTAKGEKVWIITEADRSSTCILLPEDY